jgi:hypothetical protein
MIINTEAGIDAIREIGLEENKIYIDVSLTECKESDK